MWRRAGHGGQAVPAPLLLLAVLLVGWAASPCNAQGPYAAPGNNSILLLNSTLNVRHAHMMRKVNAHMCKASLAAGCEELQDVACCGHMVQLHPCLVADIIACVHCKWAGVTATTTQRFPLEYQWVLNNTSYQSRVR